MDQYLFVQQPLMQNKTGARMDPKISAIVPDAQYGSFSFLSEFVSIFLVVVLTLT